MNKDENKPKIIAERLVSLRKRRGISSRAALASEAGMSPTTIASIERGGKDGRHMTKKTAKILADVLKVTPEYLLCEEDDENIDEKWMRLCKEETERHRAFTAYVRTLGITITYNEEQSHPFDDDDSVYNVDFGDKHMELCTHALHFWGTMIQRAVLSCYDNMLDIAGHLKYDTSCEDLPPVSVEDFVDLVHEQAERKKKGG
jgi:transcriptional regulator with XRE-family HTH domain